MVVVLQQLLKMVLNQIYGGTDVGSNSGVYRYIRVEYGGKKLETELQNLIISLSML